MDTRTEILLRNLTSPECPRWHSGRLWLSDILANQVLAVDLAGQSEVITESIRYPTGLGWNAAGMLIALAAAECVVHCVDDGICRPFLSLAEHAAGHCNDMVFDGSGRGWVGDLGYKFFAGQPRQPGRILHIQPDGVCRVAADTIDFPNGMVVSPDGLTLVVAETYGQRLLSFRIRDDGTLGDRKVFAECAGAYPDGICMDAEGAVWAADPSSSRVMRLLGGRTVETVLVSDGQRAYACALGDSDRRTLLVCTNTPREGRKPGSGTVETVRVRVPGTGWP